MMPKKQPPKWTRAVLVKKPDTIVSSDFSAREPFKPSYEEFKEPVSMFKLLAMDYARQWHVEKQKVKDVIVVSNEAAFLQRRYVIRGMLRRMQQANQEEKRFIMKRFMNIPSRYRAHEKGAKEVPEKKVVSKEVSKESVKSVEKIHKTIPKKIQENVEPFDESASVVTPCSSHQDLLDVCYRDDSNKIVCGKKPHKKEESSNESDVPPIPKREVTKGITSLIVATARTQASPEAKVDGEEECVCTCSCACKAFRKSEDETSSSSTLPEYKSVSRESVDDQIIPPVKCHIHV